VVCSLGFIEPSIKPSVFLLSGGQDLMKGTETEKTRDAKVEKTADL